MHFHQILKAKKASFVLTKKPSFVGLFVLAVVFSLFKVKISSSKTNGKYARLKITEVIVVDIANYWCRTKVTKMDIGCFCKYFKNFVLKNEFVT